MRKSPRKDLALAFGIRWKFPFCAIWIAVLAGTALSPAWIPGALQRSGSAPWDVLSGEFLLGAALFLYLDRKVFRPADRWRAEVSSGTGESIPAAAGCLAPVAAAVAERFTREISALKEELGNRGEKLRQVELLRRDLEETKTHLEAKIRDLHSIYEVSTAVAGTLDAEELFRIIPERVMRAIGLNDFCVLLYQPETGRLVCRSSAGMPGSVGADFTIGRGEGISWRVFESGEAIYVPDVRSAPEFRCYDGKKPEVRSFMSIPLLSKGKVIGILNVDHPEPNAFDGESMATMRVLATYLAIAIENAGLFHFAKTLADKDSLTLLYNHGAFHARLQIELERASRYGRSLSVIMLDLDGFKEINDRHGHLVGDRILMMTAGVLCAHLRKSDVAARYGGDEFAVILPETDLSATSAIAGRIAAGISQVRLDTREGAAISFTASIGYGTCFPDSPQRDSILSVVDRLMYESKRRGRGGILGEQL
ncbi:MAG TPA: diguanylate cyclase [Candidatus Aquicultoraceae bacterium]|nr:diguanylate cyclase [Candidatus Aquicultoraceae bacterium]